MALPELPRSSHRLQPGPDQVLTDSPPALLRSSDLVRAPSNLEGRLSRSGPLLSSSFARVLRPMGRKKAGRWALLGPSSCTSELLAGQSSELP